MTKQRVIIQMGSAHASLGDVYIGYNEARATHAAALEAFRDAKRRANVALEGALLLERSQMRRVATIGVPDPALFDRETWDSFGPDLITAYTVVPGGQRLNRQGDDGKMIVATVAYEVFVAPQTDWVIDSA